MNFKSREHLETFLDNLKIIGMGSQGVCYYNPYDNSVYKIFHQFFDEDDDIEYHVTYEEKEILRFSDVKNNTFVWPISVIRVKDEVVGYKTPYIKAKSLYQCNPMNVNLDSLFESILKARSDLDTISNHHILTYDMMYNVLYGNKFYIIDHDEYSYSDKDSLWIRKNNYENFDMEIYYFLVDGLFQDFVDSNKLLRELYKDKKDDVLIFLNQLRYSLSEMVDKEITTLQDASKCCDQKVYRRKYQRGI